MGGGGGVGGLVVVGGASLPHYPGVGHGAGESELEGIEEGIALM